MRSAPQVWSQHRPRAPQRCELGWRACFRPFLPGGRAQEGTGGAPWWGEGRRIPGNRMWTIRAACNGRCNWCVGMCQKTTGRAERTKVVTPPSWPRPSVMAFSSFNKRTKTSYLDELRASKNGLIFSSFLRNSRNSIHVVRRVIQDTDKIPFHRVCIAWEACQEMM